MESVLFFTSFGNVLKENKVLQMMCLEQSGRRALRLRKFQCSSQGIFDDIKMYFDKTLKLLGKLIFPASVLGGRGSF